MTRTHLHLRIVNMTSLPDGGPLEVSIPPGEMLEAGRDSGLGWCLPDPQRLISSRHFEIRSEKAGWMLYDLSTNGTFVNGSATRVKSPCLLHDGDRLQVGQYSIETRQETVAGQPAPTPPHISPQISPSRPAARDLPGGVDPWAVQPNPTPQPGPPAVGASHDIWAMHGQAPAPEGNSGPAPAPTPPPDFAAQTDVTPPRPAPEAFAPTPAFPSSPPAAGQQTAGAQHQTSALIEIIETAAGLAAGTLSRGDPQQAAQEIGETLRALTEELSSLLQARAVARRSVRSAQVTMIGREDNNPLKFMPTPDQALSVMFGPPRPGFQRGPAAVRAGFADIKKHQYATHAALQPALAQLLDDLSPEAIEKRLGNVRLNRKSRAWEAFVDRWDAKSHAHDNGMLDVFLAHFAEAYDRESGRG
ncbi:type VI secretion system-associated FHA domain protein TagH [Roseinatronobacter alkalisoli]|uniref:Type VI secretion system-associated FHA domain protein TagH n=1 Tax=Roseinatronobacter alkalisoli TaxID=3028235 RepID=A0ABT5TDT0_9RHOB|nr:type VI secretion system-associated FHA domain protein TagH [Roseinatronobacter sp. HJB301]MDD7972860.1 type VI secretion system-associated FHA domain protein TagH [Roseinatronobacter sp. HJB301]